MCRHPGFELEGDRRPVAPAQWPPMESVQRQCVGDLVNTSS